MSKAILVIDIPMPNSCNECNIRFRDIYSDWCPYDNPEPNGVWQYVDKGTKPDWCPLKPIPEKKHQPQYQGNGVFGYRTAMEHEYARGWNECIDYFVNKEEKTILGYCPDACGVTCFQCMDDE